MKSIPESGDLKNILEVLETKSKLLDEHSKQLNEHSKQLSDLKSKLVRKILTHL